MNHDEFEAFVSETIATLPDWVQEALHNIEFLVLDEADDYLDLDGSLKEALESGREVVSTSFIIPYPPGFPILVPGQVISKEILAFMRALDVNEIHGYRPDLGLRVFTEEALAKHAENRLLQAAQ